MTIFLEIRNKIVAVFNIFYNSVTSVICYITNGLMILIIDHTFLFVLCGKL